MIINNKLLDKYQIEFEKKYRELEANYNSTGSLHTYNTMHKYDDLIQIIRLARQQLNGRCHSCERHDRNIDNTIKKYEMYQKTNMTGFENFEEFISELKSLKF
ncbi:MAG: hypothetical protein J6C96_04045 [Oscillospiraceae bacterium]|nr:hypothetical protein [Oscillospiraceae bacterium]